MRMWKLQLGWLVTETLRRGYVNRMTINDIALYQAGLSPTRLLTMKATSLGRQFDPGADGGACVPDSTSRGLRVIFDMMQRLDLSDNERAVLITALRRLVESDPQTLSPQIQALKAILERLEPQKPQPIPDTAGTG